MSHGPQRRARSADHLTAPGKSRLLHLLAYSVTAGFLSLALGAAASLAMVSTTGKVAVWVVISGIASIAAGVGYSVARADG